MTDQIDSVRRAQVANILKKVQAGKVLSAREEKILLEYQKEQNKGKEKKTRISGGKAALAKALNVARSTVIKWSKFSDFPHHLPNGDYHLEAVVDWIRKKGFRGDDDEETPMQKLSRRKLLSQCEKIEIENRVRMRDLIEVKDVMQAWAEKIVDAKTVMRCKFENELPPQLEGLTVVQIQERCKQMIDEVLGILSNQPIKNETHPVS